MVVLRQSMCTSTTGFLSKKDVWSKYKDEVPGVSGSIKILQRHASSS